MIADIRLSAEEGTHYWASIGTSSIYKWSYRKNFHGYKGGRLSPFGEKVVEREINKIVI